MAVTGLKPGAKYILGIIAVLAIILTLKFTVLKGKDASIKDVVSTEQTSAAPTASNGGSNSGPNIEAVAPAGTFDFTPPEPVNGTLKGVVEVGSTGFNSFIVNIDKQGRYKVIKKEFGRSLAKEGMASATDINTGLKAYISDMIDQGVSGNNIHFVVSSGALLDASGGTNTNTKTIIDALKARKYFVNTVTPDQEAKLGFLAAVPKEYRDKAFGVDIGSGNRKSFWANGAGVITQSGPGAKYFQEGKSDEDVYASTKADLSKVPESKREVCFIIGGIPAKLAGKPQDGVRYTVLGDPSSYDAKGDKRTASGINIYKAIKDATGGNTTFVFDWDANFTIGYLLSINK